MCSSSDETNDTICVPATKMREDWAKCMRYILSGTDVIVTKFEKPVAVLISCKRYAELQRLDEESTVAEIKELAHEEDMQSY